MKPQIMPIHFRHFVKRLGVALGVATLLIAQSAEAVFFTPGQFGVSPTGAANYSIPIALPPGTAGMAPSVAINYNSQGGNGLLGVGWSLSGLSAITRCPKTMAQDGVRKTVQYDASDRYCMDGQRLVSTGGVYGANATVYRTERESFSRIASYGASGTPATGPAFFTVETKSGLTMYYGNSVDSAIVQQGKATVQAWALHAVIDSKGNYYTITYQDTSATNGEFYPTRIDYTGNNVTGLLPYNSVRFVYEVRPDSPALYDDGSLIKSTVRLNNIQTYAKVNGVDTLVKDYRLNYDMSVATQRSRLINVQECDGSAATATCLPQTTLAWQNGSIGFAPQQAWGGHGGGTANNFLGDFNGDGQMDLTAWNGSAWVVSLSTGAGFSPQQVWGGHGGGATNNFLGDFNGDGKTDLLAWAGVPSYWVVCLSNGSGFSPCTAWGGHGGGIGNNFMGDFNGDGKTDLSAWTGSTWVVSLSTGTSFAPQQVWGGHGGGTSNNFTGDFNGDGKLDISAWAGAPSYWVVCLSNGAGFDQCTAWGGHGGGPGNNFLGDFNGDGKTDLTAWNGAAWVVSLSTGTGFVPQQVWGGHGGGVGNNFLGDFNGDGKTDLAAWAGSPSNWVVSLSTGVGFAPQLAWGGHGGGVSNNILGDFDGDGKTDLLAWAGAPSYWVVSLSTNGGVASSVYPDLLSKVTNGLGASSSIYYKPLTDSSVYIKGAGSIYPVTEMQPPMYVVSSIASSDGIGGVVNTGYTYYYARAHQSGGGFLGFEYVNSCDRNVTPNICTQTRYTQDYPHQGLPLRVLKFTNTGTTPVPILNQVTNTWNYVTNAALGATYHVPQLATSQELSYELGTGGTTQAPWISIVTTSNTYDAYGNPTIINVTTSNPSIPSVVFTKTTTNTYANDTTNWFLGRLTGATVTSTAP